MAALPADGETGAGSLRTSPGMRIESVPLTRGPALHQPSGHVSPPALCFFSGRLSVSLNPPLWALGVELVKEARVKWSIGPSYCGFREAGLKMSSDAPSSRPQAVVS